MFEIKQDILPYVLEQCGNPVYKLPAASDAVLFWGPQLSHVKKRPMGMQYRASFYQQCAYTVGFGGGRDPHRHSIWCMGQAHGVAEDCLSQMDRAIASSDGKRAWGWRRQEDGAIASCDGKRPWGWRGQADGAMASSDGMRPWGWRGQEDRCQQ